MMALFWLESAEAPVNNNNEKVNANGTVLTSSVTRSAVGPRTGSYCLSSVYGPVLLGAADQDDLLIIGWAVQAGSATGIAAGQALYLYGDAGATHHIGVYLDKTGLGNPATVKVYRGTSAGTLLATSAPFTLPSTSGVYYHVEVKIRLHDTNGSIVVRVDEREILNVTGIDTKNGGTGTVFDAFTLYPNFMGKSDDLYGANEQGSVNTDFQGAKRIEALNPTGNGNSSQGVGSDGNSTDNYLLVDDGAGAGITTTDYVDLAVTGDKDTYVHADSAQPTGNAVAGVFVWSYAEKTDAGSRSLIPVARLSGTESDADPLPLQNGVWKLVGDVFESKPGGGAWTVADINSAEFGYKAGA